MRHWKEIPEKQQAELKLTVFDLLKQNQSITRTATDSYPGCAEPGASPVFHAHVHLQFKKNFGTAKPGNNSGFERERMGGSGGGFRPF